MIKTTFKSIAFALAVLSLIIVVLTFIDRGNMAVSSSDTFLRVTVVDLDDNPVHNAQVFVSGESFTTDNKGLSPSVQLVGLANSYDSTISDWYTVNIVVKKDGFVPALVFNCVVYSHRTRRITVKIYPNDGSPLPYVSYVESPPDQYVKKVLLEQK